MKEPSPSREAHILTGLAFFNLDFCLVHKQCGPCELYVSPSRHNIFRFSNRSRKIQPLRLLLKRKAYELECKMCE
jgi:hypothetical protein